MSIPALTTSVEIAVTIRKTINCIWLRKVMAVVISVIVFDMKVTKHMTLKIYSKSSVRDSLNNLPDRFSPFLTSIRRS